MSLPWINITGCCVSLISYIGHKNYLLALSHGPNFQYSYEVILTLISDFLDLSPFFGTILNLPLFFLCVNAMSAFDFQMGAYITKYGLLCNSFLCTVWHVAM